MSATLDCLKGYIGLSAQVATCESGLYVVALPGISLYNIEKIADKGDNSDNADAGAVFNECENRALLTFRNSFIAAMCECWSTSDRDIVDCLLCENKERLASALWWYIGHEILTERIYSDRLNRFTTIDSKKASELREEFWGRAEIEMRNIVRGIDPSKSACLEEPVRCSEFITFVTPII